MNTQIIKNPKPSIKISLATFLVVCAFSPLLWSQDGTVLSNLEQDISRLVELVKPSVVTVSARLSYSYVESTGPNIFGFWGARKEQQTIEYTNVGSGIVFNQQGHILTKAGVVGDGHGLMVTFSDGRQKPAELLGIDRRTGLAVIQVDEHQLHPARFGDSDQLKPGSWITIVGNTLGISPAVSFGLVNSVRSDGLIQLSADVSPGNSGSPIFNVKGQVVGILAGKIRGFSWSHAIPALNNGSEKSLAYPINQIRGLADDIAKYGTRPEGWLGVTAEDILGSKSLVHISGVVASGPADKAGVRVGDLVMSLDGRKFHNALELAQSIKSRMPGSVIVIDIVRGKEKKTIEVTVEQHPEPESNAVKRILSSERSADSDFMATEWRFQTEFNRYGEMDPELLINKIHQLELEIEALKTQVESWR